MMRRNLKKLINSKNLPDPRTHEKREAGMVYEDTIYLKITWPGGNAEAIKWDDVEEVHAFKRDLGSVDLICLSFKKAYKEKIYELMRRWSVTMICSKFFPVAFQVTIRIGFIQWRFQLSRLIIKLSGEGLQKKKPPRQIEKIAAGTNV